MRVDVQKLADVPDVLIERWRDLQRLAPEFGCPLVGPDFALLVARHRPETQVAIGFNGESGVAFFAFHRGSRGHVRAVGAPFCDYQAVVTDPGVKVDGDAFLAAAGIRSLSFTSLMDPYEIFDTAAMRKVEAYRIDCSGGGETRLETLRLANPKWAKNVRRLVNKMGRELGVMRVVGHDTNPAAFAALNQIKIAQFNETGMTNVLGPKWVQGLMQDLFDNQSGHFGGCLVSLYSGDKFVAGQFGVRLGDWFHPWVASTCPLSHPYSPGIIFLSEMIRNSGDFGLRMIDLSEGHGHYKSQFCREPTLVHAGVVGARAELMPTCGAGPVSVVKRRLELISALEPTFFGQARALGTAIASVPKRLQARRVHHDRPKH